jgi:hypothetical protein
VEVAMRTGLVLLRIKSDSESTEHLNRLNSDFKTASIGRRNNKGRLACPRPVSEKIKEIKMSIRINNSFKEAIYCEAKYGDPGQKLNECSILDPQFLEHKARLGEVVGQAEKDFNNSYSKLDSEQRDFLDFAAKSQGTDREGLRSNYIMSRLNAEIEKIETEVNPHSMETDQFLTGSVRPILQEICLVDPSRKITVPEGNVRILYSDSSQSGCVELRNVGIQEFIQDPLGLFGEFGDKKSRAMLVMNNPDRVIHHAAPTPEDLQ